MKLLYWLPLLTLALGAEESYHVFYSEKMDEASIRRTLQGLLPESQAKSAEWIQLPEKCQDVAHAKAQARAIECGISALPALALADEQGVYATLPLRNLTADSITTARQNKNAADRNAEASKRRFESQLFFLCARIAIEQQDDAGLAEHIKECRELLTCSCATPDNQQFIGLRLLYPLLMDEYKRGYYKGVAHTPATEAKLLEAIAALEAARDLNPQSPLGKQAFAERERLRAARRQARQYE